MVRQGPLIKTGALLALIVTIMAAVVVVGCGGGGPGNIEARDDERDAATSEETTAPEGNRSAAETVQEPVGLDVKVVTPEQAYVPAGFGEGSLWATDLATCNDTGSASASAGACALPENTLLKRLDPQTGEEVADVLLENFPTNTTEVVVGAGSVWVSSASGEADAVVRVDPETNRVVDRISVPAESSTSLAFGHGSVWIASSERDTVSRVDPQTGEVAAKIEVGRGAVDIATDESSGDVWVAGAYRAEAKKLSRVDPATNRVVAEVPIAAHSRYGGAQSVAAGEGAVWAQSADGGRLFKVDPATDEVVASLSLGEYSSDLAAYGGAVWATAQVSVGTRLYRIDPRTVRVVASEDIGPFPKVGYGRLAAGGGYVWFASGGGLARVAP